MEELKEILNTCFMQGAGRYCRTEYKWTLLGGTRCERCCGVPDYSPGYMDNFCKSWGFQKALDGTLSDDDFDEVLDHVLSMKTTRT